MIKPADGEYNPYYKSYIDSIPSQDPLGELEVNRHLLHCYVGKIPKEIGDYRYADGKWTVKEVLIHLMDVERVMAYRALMIARGDEHPIQSFDDAMFVANSEAKKRSLEQIVAEYDALRVSTITFFKGLSDEQLALSKDMGEYRLSVRALAYIIAGHELHHLGVLKERYFGKVLTL